MTNAPQVTALVNQSDLLLDANIDPVGVRGTGGGGGERGGPPREPARRM